MLKNKHTETDCQASRMDILYWCGIDVPRDQTPGFETSLDQPVVESRTNGAPPGTGGVKGRRKSKKDKLREAAARAR